MVDKCPDCGSNMIRYEADLGQAAQMAVKCTRCPYHKLVPQYERDLGWIQ